MKTIILASTLALTITTVLPVWGAEDAWYLTLGQQSPVEMFQEKVDKSIITMTESRLQMNAEPNKNHKKGLILEHMEEMQNGLKMFEIKSGSNSVEHQYDRRIMLIRGQVDMMMELIRGIISQHEMMMKSEL